MIRLSSSIDVIIPTYNGLPYLKQAVDSVLSQTHKDLTLYVVDDGSTDKGATRKYVESIKDKRVRYMHKANGGQATARNYGIRKSSSPFVAFLDSDDVWKSAKLQRQLKLFEDNSQLGLVYGLQEYINADNKILPGPNWQKRGQLFNYLLSSNKITGSGSMVLIKRSVFESLGLFREDFLIGEDWEMWLRIAHSYEIDYVPEVLASLRVLENRMQKDRTKMARGLEYMFPIMKNEFRLGPLRRSILAKACLRQATFLYFDSHQQRDARRVLLRLIKYNPLAILTANWREWLAYARILFGNEWLRRLRRKTSPEYRRRENG